jgi:hypothetical protein
MAHSSGSPDAPTLRPLPSWTGSDHSESFEEALKALESYKKKDPSKGKPFKAEAYEILSFGFISYCTLQGRRKCPNHETELL